MRSCQHRRQHRCIARWTLVPYKVLQLILSRSCPRRHLQVTASRSSASSESLRKSIQISYSKLSTLPGSLSNVQATNNRARTRVRPALGLGFRIPENCSFRMRRFGSNSFRDSQSNSSFDHTVELCIANLFWRSEGNEGAFHICDFLLNSRETY